LFVRVVPGVRLGDAATAQSAGCARMPDIHRRAADRSPGDDFHFPSQFSRSGPFSKREKYKNARTVPTIQENAAPSDY
jgi:hypothetical protein